MPTDLFLLEPLDSVGVVGRLPSQLRNRRWEALGETLEAATLERMEDLWQAAMAIEREIG